MYGMLRVMYPTTASPEIALEYIEDAVVSDKAAPLAPIAPAEAISLAANINAM
jgi:hypothetical protein